MDLKKMFSLLITSVLTALCLMPVSVSAATPFFTMDKSTVIKGESITFTCENTDSSMYVCILKAGYKNYNKASDGGDRIGVAGYCGSSTVVYSTASLSEGSYAAVLFGPGWAKYNEYTFTVIADPSNANMTIAKTLYTKGENITFSCTNVTSSCYIAVLCEGYTNYTVASSGGDRVATVMCKTSSPTLDTSSLNPGKYAAILFREGWVKQKELVFELKDPNDPKSFTLNGSNFAAGDVIRYRFHNTVSGDYVVIFPAPVKNFNTRYGLYYLKAKETTHEYTVPETLPVGNYAAVLFDNVGNWTRLQDVFFTVTARAAAKSFAMDSVIPAGQSFTATTQNTVSGDRIDIRVAGSSAALQTVSCAPTVTFAALNTGSYVAVLYENGDPAAVKAEIPFTVCSYYNDGETIRFFSDQMLDLSAEPHTEKAGKIFLGWKYANSPVSAPRQTEFSAGTVLSARYTDFSDGDFSVCGVQLRTGGMQGMRFVIKRSSAFVSSLPDGIAECGTLVLPSVILNDNTAERYAALTRDGSYSRGGTVYHAYEIPAEGILRNDADAVYYTASIVNLPEDQYFRQFSARGFLTFRDLNGITQTVYTDEYSANLYAAAKRALSEQTCLQNDRTVLTHVTDTGNAILDTAYNSANRTTVLGSPAAPQTWVYRLNQSGINVREVQIRSGKGGDAVEVVQLTDLHLNGNSSQTSLDTVRKVMNYAAGADQLIVDGDAIDALSEKNLTMLQKEVWDVNPTALVTLGNHDFVDRTGKNLTSAQVYAALQDGWQHDIYYTSRVIGGKVMVIQLDDGATTFRDCQIEPLRADLDTARQNGYTVLIFTHVSLCTRNPAETAVNSLDGSANPATYPFGTNSNNTFVGAPNMPDGATKTVYNLIVNSADVVKGVFTGHAHTDFYTEILAKTPDGADAVIPQYTLAKSDTDGGHVLKITVT